MFWSCIFYMFISFNHLYEFKNLYYYVFLIYNIFILVALSAVLLSSQPRITLYVLHWRQYAFRQETFWKQWPRTAVTIWPNCKWMARWQKISCWCNSRQTSVEFLLVSIVLAMPARWRSRWQGTVKVVKSWNGLLYHKRRSIVLQVSEGVYTAFWNMLFVFYPQI